MITLDDLPRSKNPLHYQLYYTDILQKLLKEGLITQDQIEWGDNDGKLYILTLENVEFLKTVIENSYIEKRKVLDLKKKDIKYFLMNAKNFVYIKYKQYN